MELAEKSSAIIYGKVLTTRKAGRQATIQVINYIGPGHAPALVHLPPTISSRRTDHDPCPDFSTIFHKNREYIVFLESPGPSPTLLDEDGLTALEVKEKMVKIDMRGRQEGVQTMLQQFAIIHGSHVKEPVSGDVIWGKSFDTKIIHFIMIVVLLMIIGGYIIGKSRLRCFKRNRPKL
jgi:hypothetical protein